MATAKATLTLSPEELKIIQDALKAYAESLDNLAVNIDMLPESLRGSLSRHAAANLIDKVMDLHTELT